DRIADEVHQHLGNLIAVGPHQDRGLRYLNLEQDELLCGQRLHSLHDLMQETCDRDAHAFKLDFSLLNFCEIEKIVDQSGQVLRVRSHATEMMSLVFIDRSQHLAE